MAWYTGDPPFVSPGVDIRRGEHFYNLGNPVPTQVFGGSSWSHVWAIHEYLRFYEPLIDTVASMKVDVEAILNFDGGVTVLATVEVLSEFIIIKEFQDYNTAGDIIIPQHIIENA